MILQRLVEYYDRLAGDPQWADSLAKPGYSVQKISFCVVLETDGTLQQFQSLLDSNQKKQLPRQMLVPGQSKPPGSGINPCFLWDNAAYLLGFKPDDPKPARTRESFEAFRDRHLNLEQEVASPAFNAVCSFLRNWSPEKAIEYATVLKDTVSSFGVFRIAGAHAFVHDDPAVVTFWGDHDVADPAAPRGLCLVTGQEGPIARLHEPKIKGVRGAQSAGALLVSFNDEAYKSFGKDQSYNAPVSTAATFKYTNALNQLLGRNDRRLSLGDATVVLWAEHRTPLEEYASEIFADAPPPPDDAPVEDKRRAEQVQLFLSQVREGHAGDEAIKPEDATRFYVLGLSPNAARVSIRFWADSTVGEMKARLAQHMSDTALAGSREGDPPLMIRRIVLATGRAEKDNKGRLKSYDADSVPPMLAGAVARAVLVGGPYPQTLLTAMINRLRADGIISHARVATIKACIVRNSRLQGQPKEVPVALDTNRTDPPYVIGRLFALLEKIQSDSAGGDLNTTIKDRYFSAASATPGIVFPRLIRLSQHHMAKMDTRQKVYYEKLLGEAMNKLDGFDRHLNLEDQGLFAVGYFHQRQDLFTSKKNKEGEAE
ncbi:MAG TPA: type I-C CRISPR-associated protein Cas8c/Csd1 [Tepidisphaeraceae bacterium]|jgi:CRISPR-associated protein Csd1|nr:type I-C CRISPR-associated protein Cas8c/Csd1 [Tepidisphaeraceae bacterium]